MPIFYGSYEYVAVHSDCYNFNVLKKREMIYMAWVYVAMKKANSGRSWPRDGQIYYQIGSTYYSSSGHNGLGGYVGKLKHWNQDKKKWVTEIFDYEGSSGNFYLSTYKWVTFRRLSIHNGIWGSKWTDGKNGVYYTLRYPGRLFRKEDYGIKRPLKTLPKGTKIHIASGHGYTPSNNYPNNSLVRITGYYENGSYRKTTLYLDEPTKGYYPSSYNISLP
jgi:hypothetical protein